MKWAYCYLNFAFLFILTFTFFAHKNYLLERFKFCLLNLVSAKNTIYIKYYQYYHYSFYTYLDTYY